jgi:hypothetical protein
MAGTEVFHLMEDCAKAIGLVRHLRLAQRMIDGAGQRHAGGQH